MSWVVRVGLLLAIAGGTGSVVHAQPGDDSVGDAEAGTEAEADADADAEAGAEAGAEAEAEAEAGADADADAEAEAGADADGEAETAARGVVGDSVENVDAVDDGRVTLDDVRPIAAAEQDDDDDDDEDEEEDENSAEDTGPVISLEGEYRFRFNAMSDLPLQTRERTGFPEELGQNLWATQWLRLTARLELDPTFEIIAQIDLADGMVFGDETVGVSAADRPRNSRSAFEKSGIDPRWLYVQWRSPIGVWRAGLQPSHWGLGLLANDGTHEPPFGDYRYGNQSVRLLYGTRPAGADVPLNIAIAGDLVYNDPVATLRDDERALQAVLAVQYGTERRQIGAYVVYRSQRSPTDNGLGFGGESPREGLDAWIFDLFGRYEFDEPSGGKAFIAFEGVHIRGTTTLARTAERPEDDVRQTMFALQLGRNGESTDVVLEAGYTSGDANAEDGVQRRANMHPDHRVGLILFPELLAWSTARASTLAQSDLLSGRPQPGSQLLPTDGAASGAAYLFNWFTLRPTDYLDVRLGWIWAYATSDVVDPYRQRADSRLQNYRGGNPRNRDLGLELDASILANIGLPRGVDLTVGIEGGVLIPGHAWDDAEGGRMDPLGLVRLRFGAQF